jgi:hypothetical protein
MSLEWKTDEAGNFVPWEVPHTCSSWVRAIAAELFVIG